MEERILTAKKALDSVGGVVEVCALGLPAGIGGAMYDGLESYLAPIYFGIPAVKGIEFGAGFSATRLKGSVNNDPFYYDGTQVKTRTNNHGGILGGITSGMPLIARLAFKPTPSISQEQDSVDLETGKDAKLVVKGRHDPCVAVRGVPVVEAATALGILDCMMSI
jgi:chorismate synthase